MPNFHITLRHAEFPSQITIFLEDDDKDEAAEGAVRLIANLSSEPDWEVVEIERFIRATVPTDLAEERSSDG